MRRWKAQPWTVRVVNMHAEDGPRVTVSNYLPGVWIEQLRYLGLVRVLASFETRDVIEFRCPNTKDMDCKVWAEQNAERMRSFGINAAACPQWDEGRAYSVDDAQTELIERAQARRQGRL